MRSLLLVLGALLCGVSAAMAGPNAGGVLWVHDLGIIHSDGDHSYPKPNNCAEVDNNAVVYTTPPPHQWFEIWKVYAAFPAGSSPRLKTAGWKIEFPEPAASPYSYVSMTASACQVPDEDGAGTDFFIGEFGFPTASGGQIEQSFPTGPRTFRVTTLFIFGGYGYNAGGTEAPPIWATLQHGDPAWRVFGDDAVPANYDPIMGYSSLGFGAPGTTVCPVSVDAGACCSFATGDCTMTVPAGCEFTWLGFGVPCDPQTCPIPPPTGSCCYLDGTCAVTGQAACTGVWLADGVCDPNTCAQPLPLGACCDQSTGTCVIVTQADCPFHWLGADVPCDATTCVPPTPVERTSWGQIKHRYQ